MSQPPEFPTSQDQIKGWLDSLDKDQALSLAQSIVSGNLGRSVLDDPGWGPEPEAIVLPDPPETAQLLTIRVSLNDTKPPVWRRLTIPGDFDLSQVHEVLQAAMGWTDSHLHRFFLGREWVGPSFVTSFDIEEGEEGVEETTARLDQVLREPGDRLGYTYDFGDGWTHTLRLERVEALPPAPVSEDPSAPEGALEREASSTAYALCLRGARACPPEDSGGIHGYSELAEWVRHGFDTAHLPELGIDPEELRAWLPPGWHPDHFDLDEVNSALKRLPPGGSDSVLSQMPVGVRAVIERLPLAERHLVDGWLYDDPWPAPVVISAAEAAMMTAPFAAVLGLVGDGLDLTSAGYLPPKVVLEIYTELRMHDEWIGKGNREDRTPPVARLRELTQRVGLIRKANGRLLPTARGLALRGDPVALLDHVIDRLPVETDDFGELAALMCLVAVGGGADVAISYRDWNARASLSGAVADVLSAVGWSTPVGPVRSDDVYVASRVTMHGLRLMLGRLENADAARALAAPLAAEILRRRVASR